MDGLTNIVISAEGNKYFFKNSQELCSEVLEELHNGLFLRAVYEHPDEKTAMLYFLYKTFPLYKHAPVRKVSGDPYVNHPLRVAQITGLVRGDIIARIAALGHDGPEEFYDAKIRKRINELAPKDKEQKKILEQRLEAMKNKRSRVWKTERKDMLAELDRIKKRLKRVKKHVEQEFEKHEEQIHIEYLTTMREELTSELSTLIDPQEAKYLIEHALVAMRLVTRKQNELYYDSVKKVFSQNDETSSIKDRKRAITIKFADCLANTLELDRGKYDESSLITYKQVLEIYESNVNKQHKLKKIRELERKAQALAMRKRRYQAGEFKPYEKLYRCYKNLILVNEYRIHKNEKGEIPEVSNIKLLQETINVTNTILTELCSYYLKRSGIHGQLTADKIYDFYQENEMYKQSGGYNTVTDPEQRGKKPSSFDGILKFFFNARVHGDIEPLENLYRNKADLFRVTLGLKTLAETYQENPLFVLKGFDKIKEDKIS